MKCQPISFSGVLFLIFSIGQAQSVGPGQKADLGTDNYGKTPILVGATNCFLTGRSEVTCQFILNLDSEKDTELDLDRLYSFHAIFTDGKRYNPDKISLSAFNNGQYTIDRIRTNLSPKIDYKIQLKFENLESPLNSIRYLDIGKYSGNFKWVRLENVPILGKQQSVTPLPAPQPALTPKQYLTFNATNGYGSLSGVSLNGGLYDVNLQGCHPTTDGLAACTLTLTPMRASAQEVTLEDLNVAVNGAAVTATATATPTVMTLTVTAPVNVNRIDELRLGNARFLNVGVK
ncbi:hypothetical protein [Deinococcus sp.]|uniref:hypothetical protein n=1 Tax=Deinococcus sp. TaxID=47478 RepID=UPI003CC67BCA